MDNMDDTILGVQDMDNMDDTIFGVQTWIIWMILYLEYRHG